MKNCGFPSEVLNMGDDVRLEVERGLLADLEYYGVSAKGLTIDWSDATQGGHQTFYRGGSVENLSGVRVVDPSGRVVADGWFEFVHEENSDPLIVFWDSLYTFDESGRHERRVGNFIPRHIWDRLPDHARIRNAVFAPPTAP